MEKKEFNKKKAWTIGGIAAAVLALGATVFVMLRGGHVDTDQISETMSETLSGAADAVTDFTEA